MKDKSSGLRSRGGRKGQDPADQTRPHIRHPARQQQKQNQGYVPSFLTSRPVLICLCLITSVLLIQYVVGLFVHSYLGPAGSNLSLFGLFSSTLRSSVASMTAPYPSYSLKCDFNALHKDAKSSLKRAKTAACLQKIADAACKNVEGTLYPAALENYCPREVDKRVAGHYLGCYRDSFNDRLLVGSLNKFKGTNSIKKYAFLPAAKP